MNIIINGRSVKYLEPWLDANSYRYRDKINQWLKDNNINYMHTQYGKWFVWDLDTEQDCIWFKLRWS